MPISDELVEKEVVRIITASKSPSDPNTVFAEVRNHNRQIDNSTIRNAVWRLIEKHEIELTPKRELIASKLSRSRRRVRR